MTAYLLIHQAVRHGWAIAMAGLIVFLIWLSNRNEDLREHRRSLALCLCVFAAAPLLGWLVWGFARSASAGLLTALVLGAAAVRLCFRVLDRATNDLLGGLLYDLVFAEGAFGETTRPSKKLPSLTLLQHWRKTGSVRKAFRTARRFLVKEQRAYPLWLFAAETAALDLQDLPTAMKIVRKLCSCHAFSDDQKTFAINNLKGWAATRGCDVDARALQSSFGPHPQPKPLREIDALRKQGFYEQAKARLVRIRQADPENLAAAVMLIRLYAQDLHLRLNAEQVIVELEQQPFTPAALTQYLRNSLDEWLSSPGGRAKPVRSGPAATPKPRSRTGPARIALTGAPLVRPMVGVSLPEPETGPAEPKTRSVFTENLSPRIAELVAENRLGTAVETLEKLLEQNPGDCDLLLELAQVQIVNCGNLKTGERIIARIDRDPRFSATQKSTAATKLSEWRGKYQEQQPRRAY